LNGRLREPPRHLDGVVCGKMRRLGHARVGGSNENAGCRSHWGSAIAAGRLETRERTDAVDDIADLGQALLVKCSQCIG
jgi:hypothetical protein